MKTHRKQMQGVINVCRFHDNPLTLVEIQRVLIDNLSPNQSKQAVSFCCQLGWLKRSRDARYYEVFSVNPRYAPATELVDL